MTAKNFQHDWSTDAHSHVFPSVPDGLNPEVVLILTWLKEYDETCQIARAQMIKKINGLLGFTELKK
jgi:hypothetical protein